VGRRIQGRQRGSGYVVEQRRPTDPYDVPVDAVVEGFGSVPGLMQIVSGAGLAPMDDLPVVAAACELVLESLVARKKISRSDAGAYGRQNEEKRRRPYSD